jgi:hypothetical protein
VNQSIAAGNFPPPPGLDKEEPEFNNEEDIPKDDSGASDDGKANAAKEPDASERPRDVERE